MTRFRSLTSMRLPIPGARAVRAARGAGEGGAVVVGALAEMIPTRLKAIRNPKIKSQPPQNPRQTKGRAPRGGVGGVVAAAGAVGGIETVNPAANPNPSTIQ
jgi:hypothetical protein